MNVDNQSGTDCHNCKGTKRALYFSEQAMAHEMRDCHVCRTHSPARAREALEAYDAARLVSYGTADHMRLLSRADGLLRAALAPHERSGVQCEDDRTRVMFAGIHPVSGIWTPSIRATEEGSRGTFSDWNGHAVAGWKILPVRVTYPFSSAPQAGVQTAAEINQHVAWLKQYVGGMTADNWQDMRLRAERQLEQLSSSLSSAEGK